MGCFRCLPRLRRGFWRGCLLRREVRQRAVGMMVMVPLAVVDMAVMPLFMSVDGYPHMGAGDPLPPQIWAGWPRCWLC